MKNARLSPKKEEKPEEENPSFFAQNILFYKKKPYHSINFLLHIKIVSIQAEKRKSTALQYT